MEGFLGEIRIFAGNFAPENWAFCRGQLMPINDNNALFAILGDTYGGNGQSTFALPDLRGRVPYSSGTGPGLPNHIRGAIGGVETTVMTVTSMPTHYHLVQVTKDKIKIPVGDGTATTPNPNGSLLTDTTSNFYSTTPGTYPFGVLEASLSATLSNTGDGEPFQNMQPSLVMNYIICIDGVFPSRN